MRKELICIGCPKGCSLSVDYEGIKLLDVNGNSCRVGQQYAEKEILNPERTLTTTVKVRGGQVPLVSVKTNKPIPKSRLFDAMDLLATVEIEAPVKIGDCIVRGIFGSGVDVVATKSVSKKNKP